MKTSPTIPEPEHPANQNSGFFTLIDISNALLMNKEEKTMGRVLTEIRLVHKDITERANRYGKKFLYTYFLSGYKPSSPPSLRIQTPKKELQSIVKQESTPRKREEKAEQKFTGIRLQQDLNEECF